MKFQFEQFKAVHSSFVPKVSFRGNGQIGLSQGLLQKAGIKDDRWYALLFYDVRNEAIGIKFTREENEVGAVKVVVRETEGKQGHVSRTGHISARAFLDFYDISYGGKDRRPPTFTPEITENGMVIVLLGEQMPETDADEPDVEIVDSKIGHQSETHIESETDDTDPLGTLPQPPSETPEGIDPPPPDCSAQPQESEAVSDPFK